MESVSDQHFNLMHLCEIIRQLRKLSNIYKMKDRKQNKDIVGNRKQQVGKKSLQRKEL